MMGRVLIGCDDWFDWIHLNLLAGLILQLVIDRLCIVQYFCFWEAFLQKGTEVFKSLKFGPTMNECRILFPI